MGDRGREEGNRQTEMGVGEQVERQKREGERWRTDRGGERKGGRNKEREKQGKRDRGRKR